MQAPIASEPRPFCYACHRPKSACVCAQLTRVANRTPVYVLQHARERFHPIGTARLLKLGLGNSQVEVFWPSDNAQPALAQSLLPGAALLYPHPHAEDLATLSTPISQLVVLDGTWPQARSLYRINPWLSGLRHVRLTPTAPSRYRIRKEPAAACLSTIEATVQALMLLEPETPGLAQLIDGFEAMIDRHIALRAAQPSRPYRKIRRARRLPLPPELHDPHEVVVLYAETAHRQGDKEICYIVAKKLHSGDELATTVHADAPPDGRHLDRIGLPKERFEAAPSAEIVRASLASFVGDAPVVIWQKATLPRMVPFLARPPLYLKEIFCNFTRGQSGELDTVPPRLGLSLPTVQVEGRARARLAAAHAILGYVLRGARSEHRAR